jgi:hypothetical protein
MARTLTLLLRRDPSRDNVKYLGLRPFWPDGRPMTVGMDAFCQHGQRLLALNRHLANRQECLMRLVNLPVADGEDDIPRIPGYRVRRFYLERQGRIGRIHFMDGTPTDVVFHLDRDEASVLHWIGLPYLCDGDRQWFDLAAGPADLPVDAFADHRAEAYRRAAPRTAEMVAPVSR